ncbi:TPA: restriction endonuclease subunit S [Escherichia coli]|uniref:restriction endonuclease subunit S n=1 Tax=Escherichia coli TaxID=562 RepID=UPI0005A99C47|nr:restriction endonuclease subunit S [Escherichia coli]EFH9428321.1 restriction endonuclease subunit S [Escherichia coli]EFT6934113.1 restriction endonuclease subunit S [Escherichia coli]EGA2775563.1 restriction endonuclease subunit S [Escherichia coli]EGL0838950.1 restriction endonuclease subunit S [Escherichia coli]EHE2528568.1 restriction endonuclease subunit S [Escherichia coli]
MVKTIGDACNIRTGKLDANRAVKDGDYPFFTCAEFPEKIDHYAFDDDVVLIAGNNARGNFHVSRYQGKFNAYQRTYVLTAKPGYDIDYIYYALKLELKRLREKAQGSQTKFLTMPILTSISLRDLVESEQSTVSKILKILDEKISLNNRINAELEAMAKMLYDYWFVQFDFPDGNGKPYKTSGGKMEYNATLKREIPVGWNDSILGEFIELERGVTYSKEDVKIQDNKDTIGVLRATNVTGNAVDIDDLVLIPSCKASTSQMLRKFDVLIVMSSGSKEHVGKNGVYYFEKPNAFGAFCSKITPNNKFRYFINTFLQSEWFKSYINNQCMGTNINNLTNTHITKCEIICPASDVVELFENKMMPIYSKLASNTQENSRLTKLREWLLPLLMNGQVTVK